MTDRHGFARWDEVGGDAIPYRLREDLVVTSADDRRSGRKKFFLKEAGGPEVFELGEEEYFICTSLDGNKSAQDIRSAFCERFDLDCTPKLLQDFVRELHEMGLLVRVDINTGGVGGQADRVSADDTEVEFATLRATRDDQPGQSGQTGQAVHGSPRSHPLNTFFRWRLANPTRLFDFLGKTLSPLRYIAFLLFPIVLMGGLVLFHRQFEVVQDIFELSGKASTILVGSVGLLVINLLSKIAQGAAAHRHGATIDYFGVHFVAGFFPRFFVDQKPIKGLTRRGQVWSYGAPLLVRLLLFSVGTFVWITYRQTGTWLPDIGLLVGQLSLLAFIITAFPLLPMDGLRWLSAYFDTPPVQERAFRLLFMRLRGRPAPVALSGWQVWGLGLFAVASLVCIGALIAVAYLYLGVTLEAHYRGTGVSIFLTLFALTIAWLTVLKISARRIRAVNLATAQAAAARNQQPSGAIIEPLLGQLPAGAMNRGGAVGYPMASGPSYAIRRKSPWRGRLIWLAVLGGCFYVGTLPYLYEAGGEFVVLPNARTEVVARVDGELLEVHIGEGDWVEAGQVIAVLSDWDEQRDVAVVGAELEKARAHLQRLVGGPKPEEIALAEQEVGSASERVTFNQAEMERQEELLARGVAANRNVEFAQSEYRKSRADLRVANANLALVASGAIAPDIRAARAEVVRLEHELEYRSAELARTVLVAPATGRIVTQNPELMRGRYLGVGEMFAEIEDNRIARVEVMVPETDISFVGIGNVVRIKAWAYSEDEMPGTVTAIAPSAEERGYGLVVRVKTDVANPNGELKTKMTGYAKIEADEMPVWEAYSRMITRFFRIEVWSWIP